VTREVNPVPEPAWLMWSREIQAIAQAGLEYGKDPYDIERFAALRRLAARIMADHTSADVTRIEALFDAETGYPTPKLGVRGAVFDAAGRILMVREVADANRWTLPGGWADMNQTPAQSVVREVWEESGYHARAVKLAAGVGPGAAGAAADGTLGRADALHLRTGGRGAGDQPGNQ
jgi:hypothetical protein